MEKKKKALLLKLGQRKKGGEKAISLSYEVKKKRESARSISAEGGGGEGFLP